MRPSRVRKSSSPYDESVEAAAGARCAAEQDGYWPFQDWVFANQNGENEGAFAAARLTSMASAAGLDVTTWKACVATGQPRSRPTKAETARGRRRRRQRHADDAAQRRDDRRPQERHGARRDDRRGGRGRERRVSDPAGTRGRFGLALTALAVVGLAIASYLLAVRVLGEAPACGPVKGCETVAASEYATVFGDPGRPVRRRLLDRPGRRLPRLVAARRPASAVRRLRPRARRDHRGRLPDLPRAVRHRGDLRLVRVLRRHDRGRLAVAAFAAWATSG